VGHVCEKEYIDKLHHPVDDLRYHAFTDAGRSLAYLHILAGNDVGLERHKRKNMKPKPHKFLNSLAKLKVFVYFCERFKEKV
jgi:hypothetical protein